MGRERLRVLYSFPHALGSPGIGVIAFHQVQGLLAAGFDVRIFCTSVTGSAPHAPLVRTMVVGGVRVPHRAVGMERAWRYHDARVALHLRRNPGRYDVVHAWPRGALATLRAAGRAGVARVREVPNTHTEHAFRVAEEETRRLGLPADVSRSHTFDARHLAHELREYELADMLLVPSDYVASTFLARGFPEGKLGRSQYGFDPARFQPGKEDAETARRPFTALFVGRGEPRKGLHLALQAWIDSGTAATGRFLVCGTFVPGYRERIEALLAHPSVTVMPFRHDIADVMRESDVLVLPSLEEGSALVTYEAQGCGCALVVSEAAGARCRHLVNGLVHPPGDVAALGEHFRLLAADPQLLARLRAAARQGREELTWAAAGRRIAECYHAVVDCRAAL